MTALAYTLSMKTRTAYRVHVGYTASGRNRWRRFATLADANTFCELVRQRTGIILTVIR